MKTILLISLVLVATVGASMADQTNMTIQTNMRLSIGPNDGRITGDVMTQAKGTKKTWKDPNAATTSTTTTSGTNQDTTATPVMPTSSTNQNAAATTTTATTSTTPNSTTQTAAGTTGSTTSPTSTPTCPYLKAAGGQ